jgi:hypothetical protein
MDEYNGLTELTDFFLGQPQGIAPTRTIEIVGAILYGCPIWAWKKSVDFVNSLYSSIVKQIDGINGLIKAICVPMSVDSVNPLYYF